MIYIVHQVSTCLSVNLLVNRKSTPPAISDGIESYYLIGTMWYRLKTWWFNYEIRKHNTLKLMWCTDTHMWYKVKRWYISNVIGLPGLFIRIQFDLLHSDRFFNMVILGNAYMDQWAIIYSSNCMATINHQAISWSNGDNCTHIRKLQWHCKQKQLFFKNVLFKILSLKWHTFCSGLMCWNVINGLVQKYSNSCWTVDHDGRSHLK